ncbi:MAG: TlpA family protein disulfide reductase [Isosphaeraceae bacterium]
MSVILAVLTVIFLGWTAWLRFGPPSASEPPSIGSALPPLKLLDLETGELRILLGLKGKVVWVVFWSADSPSCQTVLPRLERAWKRLRPHRSFTLVTAAAESQEPDRVRTALAQSRASLPAYLATPETLRRFDAQHADPPLHYLIDADGRVAALARGDGQDTIDRLTAEAREWLEHLGPLESTRFASFRSFLQDPL